MKTVNVSVTELLKHLKGNRDKHESNLLIARKGWREAVMEQARKVFHTAESFGMEKHESVMATEREIISFDSPPQSYLKDYDDVITQLEWEMQAQAPNEIDPVGLIIGLDQREFAQYVLDEWEWKQDFVVLRNSKYGDMA